MFYLIATILLNTLIFILFKLFPRWGMDNRQVIVVNYFVCVVTGSLVTGHFPAGATSLSQPWFTWALLTGGLFIGLFNFIAWHTVKTGMATTTIANKLSLVIPVLSSLYLYDESYNWMKGLGILAALPAVILITHTGEKKTSGGLWLYTTLLFLLSGLLDTVVKYIEHHFLPDSATQSAFVIHTFLIAGILGIPLLAVMWQYGKMKFRLRNILAGILLGIPNYFSIYLLVRLLHDDWLQSSSDIPLNNIGIVLCAVLAGVWLFRERMSWRQCAGLLLSLIAIILIAFSERYGG